jgi:hypothetical protein
MLAHARKRRDIVDPRSHTGHAFQALIDDDEIRKSPTAVRRALTPGGRFAFETRNPPVRAGERRMPENAVEVTGADGAKIRVATEVDTPFERPDRRGPSRGSAEALWIMRNGP